MKKFPLLMCLFGLSLSAAMADDAVTGVTEPQEHLDLAFPDPGVIRSISVEEGDTVSKGQVLAQLDCRVLESQLKIARMKAESTAAIQSATATLEMRRQRFDQLTKLAASQNANSDELARAKAEFEIARADTQLANEAAAEFAIEAQQIEAQIDQRTLTSPFDGVVALITHDEGASVSLNDGPIITVVKLDRLDLVIHLDHRRIDGLAPGQQIKVEAVDRPITATGTIDFISPVVDPSSGTARIRIALPNEQGQHRSGIKYRVILPGTAVAGVTEQQP